MDKFIRYLGSLGKSGKKMGSFAGRMMMMEVPLGLASGQELSMDTPPKLRQSEAHTRY